jgi:hypothetical protein
MKKEKEKEKGGSMTKKKKIECFSPWKWFGQPHGQTL